MGLVFGSLVEALRQPTIGGVVAELVLFSVPVWLALFVGLLVGWAWRPRWAADLVCGEKGNSRRDYPQLRSSSSSEFSSGLESHKAQADESTGKATSISSEDGGDGFSVTREDLGYLSQLVEMTDGGREWIQMMDKSLPTMSYKAWRRDPETGPPQYRSRTIFEDAAPETVRDFFWDDEFRMKAKWDDMLIYHKTLEECPKTGTMIVHWVRKFPFFCSDREYIIGRRIWKSDGAYYCVTKSVKNQSIPRKGKPRRVDLYYSSWCIRAVESMRGDGQRTACEVLLFHYEDMGIPWEIAKLGVRQGMWGCVKKVEPGLRAYQAARAAGEPLSPSALLAQITTKVSADELNSLDGGNGELVESQLPEKTQPLGKAIPRFLVIGGAIALACTLDRGLLTKALVCGIARKFARPGR
ncbi:unnamed protein product [Spirodela intermedia]|uniref:START domain-containing protein n=2 Tax=Spirodela intermedia TaxID=51605 RepID=A0A7I8L0H1_SPIIN|nr:unnamed protein product [Spirodela intermedia]CAA6666663.1 unnamed protein product [Spirodela intermedia]CAA7403461.1 unnamed protein product [Spirodela intermedia]